MTIPSSRSLIFEVKSTGSELEFIRVLRLGLDNFAFSRLQMSSEDFGCLRKSSDFFRNLWKWSCRLQKSQHSQDKNLTLISQKKLAGIELCRSRRVLSKKKLQCQLPSPAANGWIAVEPERWDWTSACKGALLQPLQSMFWSHVTHPDQWRYKSDRPWHQGLCPLLFFINVMGSVTSPSNWSTRMKVTRPTA